MPGFLPPTVPRPSGAAGAGQPLPQNILSFDQIKQVWAQYGGNPAAADTAAAIALAESGGNKDATNYNSNGTVDRGLFQINSVHDAQSTYDLGSNVRAAIAISNNGTNWNPWTTFKSGKYKQYLTGDHNPAGSGNVFFGDQPGSIGSTINDIPSAITGFFDQIVKDAKYAAVLIGALIVAVVLITHAVRGDGPTHRPVPIPV